MPIVVDVTSSDLDEAALSQFVGQLNIALNEEDGVSSIRATRKPEPGARVFEMLLDPQLLIQVGSQIAVPIVVGVFKAFLEREPSASLRVSAEDGSEMEFSARNFSESRVLSFIEKLVSGFDEAAPQRPPQPAPAADPITPIAKPAGHVQTQGTERKTAIIIGMDRYGDDTLEDLSYARNDAIALHNLLQGETGESFDHVELITDGDHGQALTRIEELVSRARRDDLLLVYYAGHGIVRNQKLHLAFAETRSDLVQSTAMKYGNLLDVVEQSQSRAQMIILDCCYAGAAGEATPRGAIGEQLTRELGATSRTLVITSATSTQVAREEHAYGHGVFTKHLLDALRGAADRNGDGTVDTRELFDYLEDRMQQETRQRPQKFNFKGSGAITLRRTGLNPHRDRARDLRRAVNDLQNDGMLSETQGDMLKALLRLDLNEMSDLQRRRFAHFETATEAGFRPGPFFDEWERLGRIAGAQRAAPAPEPEPQAQSNPALGYKIGKRMAQITTASSLLSSAAKKAQGARSALHDPEPALDPSKRPDAQGNPRLSWSQLDGWGRVKRVGRYAFLAFLGYVGFVAFLVFVAAIFGGF